MNKSFIKLLATLSVISASVGANAVDITGAGSSFIAPVLTKWAEAYKKTSGTSVNYASIGSGGGIKQIREKTIDFGATDGPLKGPDLEKDGMVQFPAIVGGVVTVINVPGFKPNELKLTGEVLAQIYSGEVDNWNAKEIAALNPGLKLPDQAITVVTRSDSSGTTNIFTDYLTR